MRISPVNSDDLDAVTGAVQVLNAATAVDAPRAYRWTVSGYRGWLGHGWDGDAPELHVATEEDRVLGVVELGVSTWDNPHLAWATLVVHPDRRREGRGAALLRYAEQRAHDLGRRSLGLGGWDTPGAVGFAARHEYPQRAVEVNRRQLLAAVPDEALARLHEEAAAVAADYELVRLPGRTPPDLLPALSELTDMINDAPTDELDIEDEAYSPERIAAYEQAQEGRGQRLYRVLARHRENGELAGHTVVAVEAERPSLAEQHDTTVARAHRGHRLGLLLKAEMLRWLAEAEPALESIDTWNAESNDHMIEVNARLGYQVVGRILLFQRDV